VLQLTGESAIDYFMVRCAKCKQPVKMTYRGYDPGVPYFTAECKTCGEKDDFKVQWWGLPPKAAK
jgi:hypothetical protein